MTTNVLNIDKIEFCPLSAVDEVGRLFFWDNRIFRGIVPEAVDKVRELFASGLITELAGKNLFPDSHVTDFVLEGYPLIIEHETLGPVTYPYEWSFLMLKEAALAVLDVNEVARKYGYQTKDCHGFNLIFDGVVPKFVDLGSFVKVPPAFQGWLAYDEFLRFYYYPLLMWARGHSFIARRCVLGNEMIPHAEFLAWRHPWLRPFGVDMLNKAATTFYKFRKLSSMSLQDVRVKGAKRLIPLLQKLQDHDLLPFQRLNLVSLRTKVERIKRTSCTSMWGDYHDSLIVDGVVTPTPRFLRILEIVKGLRPESLLELAGNQGALSTLLVQEEACRKITCSDYDENAVDALFRTVKKTKLSITPALLDFVYPVVTSYSKPPQERLKAEMVLALAVTHHLLLTSRLDIDDVFKVIGSYSTRYICIEFMPLGLFDGTSAPPVPEWYTVDWFRRRFKRHFTLLLEEKVEMNRIVFFGEIPTAAVGNDEVVND